MNSTVTGTIQSRRPKNDTYIKTCIVYLVTAPKDAGTILDLSGIKSIDAGFVGPQFVCVQAIHQINASGGATINLSGLESMIAPGRVQDRLGVNVKDRVRIDVSSLRSGTSAGSGAALCNLSQGGVLQLGNTNFGAPTSISLAGGSLLRAGSVSARARTTVTLDGSTVELKDLDANHGDGVAVTMKKADDRIEIAGSLLLNEKSSLIAPPEGAFLSIGQDFSFSNKDENQISLRSAIVHFNGRGMQQLEVGGLDVDIEVGLLTNDNFGLGKLIVGQEGQATTLNLVDLVPNGNRAGGP